MGGALASAMGILSSTLMTSFVQLCMASCHVSIPGGQVLARFGSRSTVEDMLVGLSTICVHIIFYSFIHYTNMAHILGLMLQDGLDIIIVGTCEKCRT